MTTRGRFQPRKTLVYSVSAAAMVALAPGAASAQEDDVSIQETVTVTGSRIPVDPNVISSVPIQSLSDDDLRLSGEINIADVVNDVPALVSSVTAENGGIDDPEGDAATGQSALNLRGLGTERTLVLINGRRSVGGFDGSQAVDISNIPTALIERVEVLTGGASALYGSDAVSGVVNFILKDDFEGLDFDLSTGISGEGDAQYFQLRGVAGANFDNDRGNVTLAVDIVDDSDLRFGDRDWAANNSRSRGQANPALRFQAGELGGETPNLSAFYNFDETGLFPSGLLIPTADEFIADYTAQFGMAPTLTASEQALFDRAANSPSRAILPFPTFSISSNRGVIAPFDFGLANLDVDGNGNDDCLDSFVGYNSTLVGAASFGIAGGCWVVNDDGSVRPYQDGLVAGNFNGFGGDGIQDDFNEDFLIPENDRVTMNFNAHYDISPNHRIFGEFSYTDARSTFGGPLNTFYDLLTGAPDNPFLPAELQGVADATGGLFITRDPTDLGPNIDQRTRETLRFAGGFSGEINDGWQYDVSATFGEFKRKTTDNNFVLLDRFFAAIDAVDDGTGNAVCRSDLDPTAVPPTTIFGIPGFDAGFYTFTPGDGSCVAANIWGGPQSISAEAVDFITTTVIDELRLEQTVFAANLVGDSEKYFTLPAGPIGFAVGAEYREEKSQNTFNPFDLGILPEGSPFGAGGLVSDVSDNGSLGFNAEGQSFNALGSYDVSDIYAEVRVPLLADVVLAKDLTLDGAFRYADYSTIGSAETWKVGLSWSPVEDIAFRGTVSQAIRAPNINELFGPDQPTTFRPVDPCDANEIGNGVDPAIRAANCAALGLPADYTDPLSARFLGVSGGNPDLMEETADTTTIGLVFTPSFIDRFVLTVDYWDVEIEDVILSVSSQDIVDNCVDDPGGIDNAFCALIQRETDTASAQFGGFRSLRQTEINFARIEAEGIDFSAAYSFDVGENTFGARLVGTNQMKLDEFPSVNDPTFVDDELGEIQRPELSGNLTLTWDRGPISLGVQTTYQDAQLLAGVENEQIPGTFSLANAQTDETYIYDLFGSYEWSDRLEFYGGVNNLADEEPFITEEAWPVSSRGRFFFVGLRYVQ
ncbi:MAG: TonB-dependent receptor [Pseudomonadota bacterium]